MLLENLQLEKSELPLLENVDYSPHPKDYRDMRLLIVMIVMFLLSGLWIMQLVFLNMTAMGVMFLIWAGLLSLILLEEIKGFKTTDLCLFFPF